MRKINESNNFSNETRTLASICMDKIDEMVVYSFGGPSKEFKEGKNGLSIFLPDGDKNIQIIIIQFLIGLFKVGIIQ